MPILEDLEYQAEEFGFYSNSCMTSSEQKDNMVLEHDMDWEKMMDER